jgi:hypothetical protein
MRTGMVDFFMRRNEACLDSLQGKRWVKSICDLGICLPPDADLIQKEVFPVGMYVCAR